MRGKKSAKPTHQNQKEKIRLRESVNLWLPSLFSRYDVYECMNVSKSIYQRYYVCMYACIYAWKLQL